MNLLKQISLGGLRKAYRVLTLLLVAAMCLIWISRQEEKTISHSVSGVDCQTDIISANFTLITAPGKTDPQQISANNATTPQMIHQEEIANETLNQEITHSVKHGVTEQRDQDETVPESKNTGKRFNVLFLVADDLRPQLNSYLGLYNPNPYNNFKMHTPHLDALSKKSLQLNRAYVQFSVCNPSRSSYMTGRRPDTTKVWNLVDFWRNTGGNFTTMPQHFKDNGYIAKGMGKIYHPGRGGGFGDPLSWSEQHVYPTNVNFYQQIKTSWWAVPENVSRDKPVQDEEITDVALEFLSNHAERARTGDENFFLGVGFVKPHIPFVFPERYAKYYPLDKMNVAPNPYVPSNLSESGWFHIEGAGVYDDIDEYSYANRYNQTLPDVMAKLLRRAYFSCVTFVDDMVGKILTRLDELGLSNNTIVTFNGDHGYHLGENGMWGKHTNLEQSTHAPLMLHIPGRTDGGIQSDSLVEFIDFFPTLAEAAGLGKLPECPPDSGDVALCTEGKSFLNLIDNPRDSFRSRSYSQVARCQSMGYTVRTERFRYVEWPPLNQTRTSDTECRYDILWDKLLGKELFEMVNDPEENVNIEHEEMHADTVRELSRDMHIQFGDSFTAHCGLFGLS